jgi:hypothetical protein
VAYLHHQIHAAGLKSDFGLRHELKPNGVGRLRTYGYVCHRLTARDRFEEQGRPDSRCTRGQESGAALGDVYTLGAKTRRRHPYARRLRSFLSACGSP